MTKTSAADNIPLTEVNAHWGISTADFGLFLDRGAALLPGLCFPFGVLARGGPAAAALCDLTPASLLRLQFSASVSDSARLELLGPADWESWPAAGRGPASCWSRWRRIYCAQQFSTRLPRDN
jgi:hypothetical protein